MSTEGSLYELLPEEIKRQTFHRVQIRNGVNSTITVSGKKYLLSITLEDDETRQILRNCLRDITILVEYTDIYNSKFEPVQRKLDFFGLNNFRIQITADALKKITK